MISITHFICKPLFRQFEIESISLYRANLHEIVLPGISRFSMLIFWHLNVKRHISVKVRLKSDRRKKIIILKISRNQSSSFSKWFCSSEMCKSYVSPNTFTLLILKLFAQNNLLSDARKGSGQKTSVAFSSSLCSEGTRMRYTPTRFGQSRERSCRRSHNQQLSVLPDVFKSRK